MANITVMLDTVGYDSKPSDQIPAITKRLKRLEPCTISAEEFAQAVADGHTFCCGCFEPDASKPFGHGRFIGQQIFAIDIDNDTVVLDADGKPKKDEQGHVIKRSLMPDEKGYLGMWAAIDRWAKLFHADPLLVYPSFRYRFDGGMAKRWDKETNMKYRLVLDAGDLVTNPEQAAKIREKLLKAFPEADSSCSNANRLYFGSCGNAWLNCDGEERFYVRRA